VAFLIGRFWSYFIAGRKCIFCSIVWDNKNECFKLHLVNSGQTTIHVTFMSLYDKKYFKHNNISLAKRIRQYIGNKISGRLNEEKIINRYRRHICFSFGYEPKNKPIVLVKSGGWYSCKISKKEYKSIYTWLRAYNYDYNAIGLLIETLGLGIFRKKIFISSTAQNMLECGKIDITSVRQSARHQDQNCTNV